jgi:putative DNA primase/helicase
MYKDNVAQDNPHVNSDDLPRFEEAILRAKCAELVAQSYKGKRLMAALFELNESFDEPASRDFIYKLCEQYTDPIEAAIDSDDVTQLFRIAPILAQLTPLEWGVIKQQIKERYEKRVNLNDLVSAVKDEQRRAKLKEEGEKRDVADIARDWASSHREDWAYDAVYDVWRMWNGAYWQEQPKTHLLDKEAVAALQDASTNVTTQSSINLFERLAEADCLRDFTSKPGLINFDNGTLELATGQLRNYSKEDNLTYCLPYCYNPYGTHPNIDRFLAEVLPDEYARMALMAHGGLALMGDLFIHFFYVLIGARRSGKSTTLALFNALCGALDPYTFAGHSIFNRDVEGKRSRYKWSKNKIACIDELPQEALREEELLKAMSAHSGVEMRGIGKDEHTDNRWRPKLFMATNDQPRYNDYSSAIKERSIFAEIRAARPKEEREARLFIDKLLPEIGAFAVTCLDLARQVVNRGYYPLSAEMKQLIDRIANEGNPLKDFVQEMCIIEGFNVTKIASSILHEQYKTFCDERGHKRVMASNTLSMTLRTMDSRITVPSHPIRIEGKLQRGLLGIRLRTVDDPDPKPAYENDPPLICLNASGGVYGVYGPQNPIVDGENQPVERRENGLYTVYTVNDSHIQTSETHLPCDEDAQGRSNYIKDIGGKKSYTPYTVDANEPIERDESVNGYKKASYTPYTQEKCAVPGCEKPGYKVADKRLFCKNHWQAAVAR